MASQVKCELCGALYGGLRGKFVCVTDMDNGTLSESFWESNIGLCNESGGTGDTFIETCIKCSIHKIGW